MDPLALMDPNASPHRSRSLSQWGSCTKSSLKPYLDHTPMVHAASDSGHGHGHVETAGSFDEACRAILIDLQGALTNEHRRQVQRLEAKISALEGVGGRARRSVHHGNGSFVDHQRPTAQKYHASPSPSLRAPSPSLRILQHEVADAPFNVLPCQPDTVPPAAAAHKVTVHSPEFEDPQTSTPMVSCQVSYMDSVQSNGDEVISVASAAKQQTKKVMAFGDEVGFCEDGGVEASSSGSVSNLSEAAEHVFHTLDAWDGACQKARKPSRAIVNVTKLISKASGDHLEEAAGRFERTLQRFVVHPTSTKRLIWEALALFLLFLDVLVIPVQFLDPPRFTLITLSTWVARIFWTLDIVFAFFTGCPSPSEEGTAEMLPRVVATRYLRTRFPLDGVIVSCDWLYVAAAGTGSAGTLRLIMIVRALRVLRVVRILRARNVTEYFFERVRSEVGWTTTYVLGILLTLDLLIHVIACIWFGMQIRDGSSELVSLDAPFTEGYVRCFHFVLSLFVGEHIASPRNLVERVFTIAILIFGIIVTASFVGSLTTAMTRLQILASQRSAQFAALSRYLSDCNVSRKLAMRVQRNAHHAFKKRRRNIPENSVELLGLISDPLRAEIHHEVYIPVLTRHPFFYAYDSVDTTGMRQICHTVVTEISIARGDVLFSEFEVPAAPKMYFITDGKLSYNRGAWEQMRVTPDHWASEPSLWTTWAHLGSLVARAECQFLAIDAHRFINIMSQFSSPIPGIYAEGFVSSLNHSGSLTDIGGDSESIRQVVQESFADFHPVLSSSAASAGKGGQWSLLFSPAQSQSSMSASSLLSTYSGFEALRGKASKVVACLWWYVPGPLCTCCKSWFSVY